MRYLDIFIQTQRLAPPRQAESCIVKLELACLEVLPEGAAKLDELQALNCVVEQAGEGDDTNKNKASSLCDANPLEET